MRKLRTPFTALSVALTFVLLLGAAPVLAQGTVVYDSIPSPTPPNVPSLGYQASQTAEFGDEIKLEVDTPRRTGFATVLMSSWSLHSTYPSMPAAGYPHPITLNIYLDAAAAAAHAPVATVTKTFTIPWRPEADPTCGTAWLANDGNCYNGFAFKITFDLRSFNYDLPEQFIYGIAYNTQSWGYAPLVVSGPYNSLNVGLHEAPPPVAVGIDVNPDELYRSFGTVTAGFLPETGWTPYTPAVQFTTFALPTTTASCKNGAWQNLVRSDFTSFKNQGACVSYVNTGQ